VVFLHPWDLEMSTKTCSTIWLVTLVMLLWITKIKLEWHMRPCSLQGHPFLSGIFFYAVLVSFSYFERRISTGFLYLIVCSIPLVPKGRA
jgi:hypothetical protein